MTRSFLIPGIWSNSDSSPNTHLEFDLHQVVSGFVEDKTDGDAMRVHVHCSGARYAIISSNKDRHERLVIAYQDEDCLRDLIAAPRIIGLGFGSREKAIANLKSCASDAAPSKQKPEVTAMFHATQANVELAGGPATLCNPLLRQSLPSSTRRTSCP